MKSTTKPSHIGRKISKIRELRGMKLEALVIAIGVSQQTISNIENSDDVEENVLLKIAEVLDVSPEGIKNFSEEAVFNIINNTYHNISSDNSTLIVSSVNYQPTRLSFSKNAFSVTGKAFFYLFKQGKEKLQMFF